MTAKAPLTAISEISDIGRILGKAELGNDALSMPATCASGSREVMVVGYRTPAVRKLEGVSQSWSWYRLAQALSDPLALVWPACVGRRSSVSTRSALWLYTGSRLPCAGVVRIPVGETCNCAWSSCWEG